MWSPRIGKLPSLLVVLALVSGLQIGIAGSAPAAGDRAATAVARDRSSIAARSSVTASTLIHEAFTEMASPSNAWYAEGAACLTAGTKATPKTSIVPCNGAAPQDADGVGALQLTGSPTTTTGMVVYRTPLATNAGLQITFTDYSFDGSAPGGNGLASFLADASQALPTVPGASGANLGYAGNASRPGLAHAYVGIGLDEIGNFSAPATGRPGGPGAVPETIAVRGNAYQYIGGYRNGSGLAASLPSHLDNPSAVKRPANAPTITESLSSAGVLAVAIDFHNGKGPVSFYKQSIVGVNGEPAVPAHVYLGFLGASGAHYNRHQIADLTVSTIGPAPSPTPTATAHPTATPTIRPTATPTAAPTARPTATPTPNASAVSVTTYHNDALRTGWNARETILNASNVASAAFGLQKTVALDGRVDAQPLLLAKQPIAGYGTHDAVYVATQNDSVYVFDAQSGASLLFRNFGTPVPYTFKNGDDNIFPVMGITGTPVIDRSRNALYVVTDTFHGAYDAFTVHKLALDTLKDLVPPVVISASTVLNNGVTYTFNPRMALQRPALLEANGNVYVPVGINSDYNTTADGLFVAYNADTLTKLPASNFNDRVAEPNGELLAGIWQSGFGPAADPAGNVYFSTANSNARYASYDAKYNHPNSVMKLSPGLGTLLDSFTPSNYFALDQVDHDLGSGGTMLLPDQPGSFPHIAVAGGKDGREFVLNRDNLGGYTANGPDKVLGTIPMGVCLCGPAYFAGADRIGRIVTGGRNGVSAWKLNASSRFSVSADSSTGGKVVQELPDTGGTLPVVSSNGTAAGTAIVWFIQRPATSSDSDPGTPVTLHAYDGANLAHSLFSAYAGTWLHAKNSNANISPTVANGRVYVASNKQLRIFGLLGAAAKAAYARLQ